MNEQQANIDQLVHVNKLSVTFYTPLGTIRAVRDASFEVGHGEVLGLVGESGCGKSTVAYAVMGYLPGINSVEGDIHFEGSDILSMSASELHRIRGDRIAMVYQDPATSLNPSMRVGPQVEEILQGNLGLDPEQSKNRSVELFESVGLADPDGIGRSYPHQLSGGMQQRIVIAMALACDPNLLIMDEPTTGLDVTTEATILDLVVSLKRRVRAGILFVSHNLGVIARVADRVAVMYAGQIIEQAPVRQLYKNPQHPYTAGLLTCVPQPPSHDGTIDRLTGIPGSVYDAGKSNINECLFAERCPMAQEQCRAEAPDMFDAGNSRQSRCFFWNDVKPGIWGETERRMEVHQATSPTLTAKGLRRFYGQWRRKYLFFGPRVEPPVRAVVDVDLDVWSGRTLGIVGESGSGKTTVARIVTGLVERNRGELYLNEEDLAPLVEDRSQEQQAALRMVFQNPTASLNPWLPISHPILRSLKKHAHMNRKESQEYAIELLQAVGLAPTYMERLPGELSGGEQQRVALASAFAGNADLIVADEAVSSLDVSVQAQVLELLEKHQQKEGTSYIFISHDLGVIRYVSDDILVLYAGHIAESGTAKSVLNPPSHPYTEALLSAAPVPDPDAKLNDIRLPGAVPTLRERFQGCFFTGRCPRKIGAICDHTPPSAQSGSGSSGHIIYCHIPVEELTTMQLK
ncbi:dipeptide ABC transporter ATP-binding protein [Chloroflexota bacterium]